MAKHDLMPGDKVTDGETEGRVTSRGATRAQGYEVTVKTETGDRVYHNDEIDRLNRR